jgi:hypothetical protein
MLHFPVYKPAVSDHMTLETMPYFAVYVEWGNSVEYLRSRFSEERECSLWLTLTVERA